MENIKSSMLDSILGSFSNSPLYMLTVTTCIVYLIDVLSKVFK